MSWFIGKAVRHERKKDPYASEAKTKALLVPDIRTEAERKLVKMMGERGADEQGAEAYLILRQIAVDLLAEKPAQTEVIAGRTVKVDWKAQALELRELVRLGGIKIAELEAALAEQPAPVQQEPVADEKKYRLLEHGDRIESGDTVLDSDSVTWHPLSGWEIGMRWGGNLMPMRRPIEAAHQIVIKGEA